MTTPTTPTNLRAFHVLTRTRIKDKKAHPYLESYWPDAVRADALSREELLELKHKRMDSLVQHVTRHVPFYQRWAKSSGYTPGDTFEITDLPIVTKDDYRKSIDDFQSDAYPLSEMGLVKTSGSSGEPFLFRGHKSVADYTYACLWRNLARFGLRPGQKRAYLWGRSWSFTERGLGALKMKARLRLRDWMNNTLAFDAYQLTDQNVASAVKQLESFKPTYMHGYASALYTVARYILDHKQHLGKMRLKAAVTESEKLYPFQKEAMEEAFQCPVVEVYGSVEFGSMACVDPEGHFRINEDVYHFETDQNQSAVITNLTGKAFPFIRYKLGDLIEIEDIVPPGLPYQTLKRVVGRTVDMIPVAKGGYIHGVSLTHAINPHLDVVRKFQIRQTALDRFDIQLITNADLPGTVTQKITEDIKDLAGQNTTVNIHVVDEIPPASSGKFRMVVSDVSDIAKQVTQSDEHLQPE